MAAEIGFHLNQVWHVQVAADQALNDRQAMAIAAEAGAKAIRYDLNWRDVTSSSEAAFDPNSFVAKSADYQRYLVLRGYGQDGGALQGVYADLREAASLGLKAVININTIPDWAKRFPGEPYKGVDQPNPMAFLLADDRRVGEFVHDLIIYCARQDDGQGLAVLKAIQGFQIFNEVGGWTQQYNPGYGFTRERQLPYVEYLKLLDHSIAMKSRAFAAVGLGASQPPVMGPNLAGTYTPAFWRAVAAYQPINAESTLASGKLKLEGISLHPYGITVRPDVDLEREEAELPGHYGVNNAYANLGSHLTFNRIMQPTDDWLWMLSMIDRDPVKSTAWNLYRYADVEDPSRINESGKAKNYVADRYYDVSPELGVERTLALIDDLGLSALSVHFTEFGASSFVGQKDGDGLRNTTFVDPHRFGPPSDAASLSKPLAESLQAEALVQSLGLIENWDFVSTATAFTLFDRGAPGYVEQFGLAANKLGKGLSPRWKPAGQVFKAFLKNQTVSMVALAGDFGVDLHIEGTDEPLRRKANHNETVLLRDGADRFDGEAGDDIVFGGSEADTLFGGAGYDKLYGGSGNDVLEGGAGNDRLKGDGGDDTLTGAEGRDNFVFSSYAMSPSGKSGFDVITDFDPSEDRITLVGLSGDKAGLPKRLQQTPDGTLLNWTIRNDVILLKNVKVDDLSGKHFHVLK